MCALDHVTRGGNDPIHLYTLTLTPADPDTLTLADPDTLTH